MTTGPEGEGTRRIQKSEAAFRTISEVAQELDVPQHVLRFWETRFPAIQPLKRGGGRRYYRPEDVALLRAIRARLYDDGFTIKGVRKLLAEKGVEALVAAPASEPVRPASPGSEPDLPMELPLAPRTDLSARQRTEIKAAIAALARLKSDIDQALEQDREVSSQE